MKNEVYQIDICLKWQKINGKKFPKGSMVGEDTRGTFACTDYRCKGYSKNNRPVLALWRYYKDKWHLNNEANITTEEILVEYYMHEDLCQIDIGGYTEDLQNNDCRRIRKLHITKAFGMSYYGFKLPKGAMYGQDEKGIFICKDYRVKGAGYSADGYPILAIIRPQQEHPFYDATPIRNKWTSKLEANATTNAIMRMFYSHEEECKIDYSDQIKQIAKKINHKPERDEVHYTGNPGGVWSRTTDDRKSLVYVIGNRPLEKRSTSIIKSRNA